MDGSVRQLAPLSAPLNLGARRILVIAVGQFSGQRRRPTAEAAYPSFAQAAGHALSTIFLDNLAADVERMMQVNRARRTGAAGVSCASGMPVGHVDALVLAPSRDLGALALQYAIACRDAVRTLLRALGSTQGTGANLTSYLCSTADSAARCIALGYADTMARRDDVVAFSPARQSRVAAAAAEFRLARPGGRLATMQLIVPSLPAPKNALRLSRYCAAIDAPVVKARRLVEPVVVRIVAGAAHQRIGELIAAELDRRAGARNRG